MDVSWLRIMLERRLFVDIVVRPRMFPQKILPLFSDERYQTQS